MHQRSLIAYRTLHAIATAAAWVISLRRELVHHHLTDEECEADGLPYGTTEPAIHLIRVHGPAPWRVDAWMDRDEDPAGCLHIDLGGWTAQVFYLRKGQAAAVA